MLFFEQLISGRDVMFKCLIRGVFLFVLTTQTVLGASTEAVYGDKAMISSRSTLASAAGIEIMAQGGNAVDGAVATAFALAVTYPSAGNIGGGGFAVIHFPDGRVLTQDHREKAPGTAHRDMYLDADGNEVKGLSRDTHLAAGVPGSVDGLLDLLERHGTKSRQEVLLPAIRLAKEGFVLDRYMARHINTVGKRLQDTPAAKKVFSMGDRLVEAGDVWQQPDLAVTLQRIHDKGRAGFYEGKTADLIVAEMKRGNGIITHEDLKNYRSVWREPVMTTYRGYDVWTMGPPSSAVLVLQILNMLEPYDVASMGYGAAELIHLMIEAERRSYADRAEHLGDPDFWDVPLEGLVSKEYALKRFADVDLEKASDSDDILAGYPAGKESMETTHFSVMDSNGMAVAFTTTLNSSYGSKLVVDGAGFLLNNEMDDFSVKPNTMNQFDLIGREANAIKPNKRMLSSMSPTIVSKDGKPVLVTGSPGGSTIITTTLQVILNVIDHGMPLHDAVSMPRFHHQWTPNRIIYERYAFSPDTQRILEALGHVGLMEWPYGRGIGDANSVMMKDGVLQGVKDPRAEGVAVGF
ncbi:MAG: gamma-glutamyltransferase [Pseudomonadales bacterium]|nr:gamma-glutamyltransferase [Pseudomonadales bacterium]